MSSNSWRILIAVVVAAHGIGHTYFLMHAAGLVKQGRAGHSWLLSGRLPGAAVKWSAVMLWLLLTAGFVAAGVGVFGQHDWWRGLAVVSSAVSLAGLLLFVQRSMPFLNAGVMDIAILVALLLLQWPSVDLVGS